jgi:hypothetical protein
LGVEALPPAGVAVLRRAAGKTAAAHGPLDVAALPVPPDAEASQSSDAVALLIEQAAVAAKARQWEAVQAHAPQVVAVRADARAMQGVVYSPAQVRADAAPVVAEHGLEPEA